MDTQISRERLKWKSNGEKEGKKERKGGAMVRETNRDKMLAQKSWHMKIRDGNLKK